MTWRCNFPHMKKINIKKNRNIYFPVISPVGSDRATPTLWLFLSAPEKLPSHLDTNRDVGLGPTVLLKLAHCFHLPHSAPSGLAE